MPKAIADTDGFYQNQYIRKGQRFEVDDATAKEADAIAKDRDGSGKPKKYTWIRLEQNLSADERKNLDTLHAQDSLPASEKTVDTNAADPKLHPQAGQPQREAAPVAQDHLIADEEMDAEPSQRGKPARKR